MKKFCILKFCDDYSFLKNKIIFSKNKKFRDYYVQKFNPYIIKEFYFGGLSELGGYEVILPITKNDAINNEIMFESLVEKTIDQLRDDVVIIDYGEVFYKSEGIKDLDKINVSIFYIKEILSKAIKQNNYSRRDVNVSIIAGSFEHTEIVLNEIYDNLNFLNIVDRENCFSQYENKTDAIFCDCGLEISFSNKVMDADIVININENPHRFLTDIKDNTVIIDFAKSVDKSKVKGKIVQDITVKIKDTYLKDKELELILYSKSYVYRQYKENFCEYSKYLYIKNELFNINAKFNNYKVYS